MFCGFYIWFREVRNVFFYSSVNVGKKQWDIIDDFGKFSIGRNYNIVHKQQKKYINQDYLANILSIVDGNVRLSQIKMFCVFLQLPLNMIFAIKILYFIKICCVVRWFVTWTTNDQLCLASLYKRLVAQI